MWSNSYINPQVYIGQLLMYMMSDSYSVEYMHRTSVSILIKNNLFDSILPNSSLIPVLLRVEETTMVHAKEDGYNYVK